MSDLNQPYDPSAPEGGSPGGAYVSKRDFRIILGGIVVLTVMLIPVYKVLERNSQKARCAQNVAAIANGLGQYAALHDDRFPPIMRTLGNGSPDLGASGLPYTWASDVQEFMNPRVNFLCPSARDEEIVRVESHNGGSIPVTYGMYAPYGGYLRSIIDNPDQTLLVAETSNYGGANTYDPEPYLDLSGNKIPHDAFAIGWSDGNLAASGASKYVTRLAFPDSAGGKFTKDGPSRHDAGIHAITAAGAASPLLKPEAAIIERRYANDLPQGLWAVPPISRRRNP
jgi:hypothetical protein